jgi:hypothetical protein
LHYSGEPSHGEKIYKQLKNAMAGQFPDPQVGDRSEAWMYATAMLVARARYAKERAANQMDPRYVVEMLPVRESEYGLVPGANDTIPQRHAALVAKYLLAQGARYTAVTAALTAAIGSDFLYYRVTKASEIFAFPASPALSGIFDIAKAVGQVVHLTTPVAVLGVPRVVNYTAISPAALIQTGDHVLVGVNNMGLAEVVTATAATSTTFTATFTKSHDAGDVCTTRYFPYWLSTQGHVLVIVKPSTPNDPEKMRKVNTVMAEIMRSFVTWDVVPDDGSGTATAALTVADPVLGRVYYAGLGAVTYP